MIVIIIVIALMFLMGYLRTKRLMDDVNQIGKENKEDDQKSGS